MNTTSFNIEAEKHMDFLNGKVVRVLKGYGCICIVNVEVNSADVILIKVNEDMCAVLVNCPEYNSYERYIDLTGKRR